MNYRRDDDAPQTPKIPVHIRVEEDGRQDDRRDQHAKDAFVEFHGSGS